MKVDYSEHDRLFVKPVLDFDWYATGYCINHFDELWELRFIKGVRTEAIDLLVRGLRSSPVAVGRIRFLNIESLSFSQTITPIKNFCQLHSLQLHNVSTDHDDEVILRQLIAPGSELTWLEYSVDDKIFSNTIIPLLFEQSSAPNLTLFIQGKVFMETELLPSSNTNLEILSITQNLLRSLAALILNITTLTNLMVIDPLDSDLPVLTNIVQSHRTLKVLHIGRIRDLNDDSTNLLQLIEVVSSSKMKELRIDTSDYDGLLPHIQNSKNLTSC